MAEAGGGSYSPKEDPDVAAERAAVESAFMHRRRDAETHSTSAANIAHAPIEIRSLRKVYRGSKVAVHDLTLAIHEDECFGLLGPNGAGKTSTIAMLTGLYPPTSGETTICGFDLSTQLHRIHEAMGVCPQFDILWPLLTVLEHLTFYMRLKGVPSDDVHDRANAAAMSVELGHAADRLVSRISGGMKRRVSLAIALLAEPSVIFLDEPTTGLDPETRRSMWSLIDIAKARRSIVLTTHSMEEADALCGRIGIMAYGRMRCIGTSLHLKQRFGDGFHIEVTHLEGAAEAAAAFLTQLLPDAVPTADAGSASGNTLVLLLPRGGAQLSTLFAHMEARPPEARIVHWSLRQPSLEEVFLHISRLAEAEQHGTQVGEGEHDRPTVARGHVDL
jgi:ABC-type multidrug transport system ATPase subunit